MTTQPLSPIDISATLKMYMEFIELSKRNYENLLKSAPLRANGMDGKKAEVEGITSPNDAALLNWRESGRKSSSVSRKTRWSSGNSSAAAGSSTSIFRGKSRSVAH